MQLLDYIFNIGGNYTASINGMTEATGVKPFCGIIQ